MADYVFKGLTGILGTVNIADPSTATIGDLIVAIATEEGLDIDYYAISVENNPSINDTDLDDSTITITASGITTDNRLICTPRQQGTKERRQIQRLEIAQRKRTGGLAGDSTQGPYYRLGNTYDRDLLPTKYSGNDVVDNANVGGLQPGRPWT